MRLTSKGESRFQWMAGAFYEDVYDWWDYGAQIPGYMTTTSWEYAQYLAYYYNASATTSSIRLTRPTSTTSGTYDRTVKQTAVFGELSFDLTENWTVTGGARWFEYEREVSEVRATSRWVSGRRRLRGRRRAWRARARTPTRCSSSRRSTASATRR